MSADRLRVSRLTSRCGKLSLHSLCVFLHTPRFQTLSVLPRFRLNTPEVYVFQKHGLETYGSIDVVVANAGIFEGGLLLEDKVTENGILAVSRVAFLPLV